MSRILIADDTLDLLSQLEVVAGWHSDDVVSCKSGAEAEAEIESGEFDLIVTDQVMETNDAGLRVLKIAKEKAPETPVILITSYTDRTVNQSILDQEPYDLISRNNPGFEYVNHLDFRVTAALKYRRLLLERREDEGEPDLDVSFFSGPAAAGPAVSQASGPGTDSQVNSSVLVIRLPGLNSLTDALAESLRRELSSGQDPIRVEVAHPMDGNPEAIEMTGAVIVPVARGSTDLMGFPAWWPRVIDRIWTNPGFPLIGILFDDEPSPGFLRMAKIFRSAMGIPNAKEIGEFLGECLRDPGYFAREGRERAHTARGELNNRIGRLTEPTKGNEESEARRGEDEIG